MNRIGRGATLSGAALLLTLSVPSVLAQPVQLNTIKDVVERLYACWEPPVRANPKVTVSVIVTFRRDGTILGHPKITYESEQATDDDRMLYRIAIIKSLERCTPLSFSEGLGGAIAGRLFALRLGSRRYVPQNKERSAWLKTTH